MRHRAVLILSLAVGACSPPAGPRTLNTIAAEISGQPVDDTKWSCGRSVPVSPGTECSRDFKLEGWWKTRLRVRRDERVVGVVQAKDKLVVVVESPNHCGGGEPPTEMDVEVLLPPPQRLVARAELFTGPACGPDRPPVP